MNAADKRRWKEFRWKVATTLMTKHKWKGELAAPIAVLEPTDGIVIVKLWNQGAMVEEVAGAIVQYGVNAILSTAEVKYVPTNPQTEGK